MQLVAQMKMLCNNNVYTAIIKMKVNDFYWFGFNFYSVVDIIMKVAEKYRICQKQKKKDRSAAALKFIVA